jgi:hypothetical protein
MRIRVIQIARSLNGEAFDRAVAAELEAHVDMHAADNVRQGMDVATARRDALMKLGGVQQTMELCRDVATIRWLVRLVHHR